ncbi:MAG TPA: LamG domain-containing protein [Pyrinomonadaceae bacterium]|nr:LamG domain-containing protein [Acidobacteriota bacterium]HQZ96711.1 LamG domain-containing protein [Pyrinomonadaceae bacterium]
MRLFSILLILVSALAGYAQIGEITRRSVIWKVDNIKKIGGHDVEVMGAPKVVKTDRGKAVVFNGMRDGLFISNNPLAGAYRFTIEAVFRPDAGGEKEQRWLHVEDTENVESRAMLETRLNGNEWFLDTFLKSGDNRMPLFAENFKHQAGRWYHIALVYDGTEMRHYVDGKLELAGKINFKTFGKGITSIGVRQNKVYWFKGAVLKARFTNRPLAPAQFMK